MHASLDLLAAVGAAAANQPSSKSTPLAQNMQPAPSVTTTASTAPMSAPPISLAPSSYCPPIPHSPPSDVTTSTATRPTHPNSKHVNNTNINTPKRTKSRSNSTNVQKRGTKRNVDSITQQDPDHSSTPSPSNSNHNNSNDNNTQSAKTSAEEVQDNKKAMRAERNRQSAAASRERKKRHIKDLTEKVKYLTECNTSLQYSLDLQKKRAEETEIRLQQEIVTLRHQLTHKPTYIQQPPPQSHQMTMHHLTHRGPVTY